MKIGLIDVDGHNFPNLPLMKISAYHKAKGDTVEWYEPLFHSVGETFDKVYMSKVFSDEYTTDYQYYVNAKEVIKGGTGYCISVVDGKEVFDESKNFNLPYEIELRDNKSIVDAISLDKKNLGDTLKIILLKDIGESIIYNTTSKFFQEVR